MDKAYFSKNDLQELEKSFKIRLLNSISGHKSANLIGTKGNTENLAIFSSVVHLGSSPALLGFIIRPNTVRRDTYNNILQLGEYTINHVHKNIVENAHYTSAKFPENESEFEKVNLSPKYITGFNAPFVAESKVQIGLKLISTTPIKENGCILIIGEVVHLHVDKNCLLEDGQLNWNLLNSSTVTGLNQYHSTSQIAEYPYAEVTAVPSFAKKKKQRPDNVVYNEEKDSYEPAIKKYGTDLSAPAIQQENINHWKNIGTSKVNHQLKVRFEHLKKEYEDMLELYNWNEIIYNSKFEFEPVVGEVYHLYQKENGVYFLSQIGPDEWDKKYIGSFKLDLERVFVRVNQSETGSISLK